ncbi:Kin17_mid domain-containing protein [Pseudoscourfieldia marina]
MLPAGDHRSFQVRMLQVDSYNVNRPSAHFHVLLDNEVYGPFYRIRVRPLRLPHAHSPVYTIIVVVTKMMTTNVRNMRSIVTASSAVLVALLAVVVMLSAVSGVSADSSTTTTYETTKYVDEYKSGYYVDEYKTGYYPKYKWWAPWTWKYSSNKYNDNKYDSGYDSGYSKYGSGYSKYDSGYSKYGSGYSKYDSGYSKYDSGYGYSKYDSKYGVGPYYGKQYEQDEYYPCDTFYPKPKWYSPFTWKYRKYAKFDYYSGPCEVKKEEHCLPFWGHPDDASEATWYTVTHASGGGGCHGGAKNGCDTPPGRRRQLLDRPLYETQYFYAKSEAHGLTFTLTNHYYQTLWYYNEKWVCAIDDSRKNAICTMAGRFGGGYSTPEKCILTFKTHQKGGKCIPHHMALDCGKPPYVETSKFSKIDYRDIPHKDITTTTTTTTAAATTTTTTTTTAAATTTTTTTTTTHAFEECTACDGSRRLVGTKYTSCDPEPFEGETITLDTITLFDIADDISVLSGDPTNVTITSFPCMTNSSQQVDFDFGFDDLFLIPNPFPNLAEVRFANWVTGPGQNRDRGVTGRFWFADSASLTSIYAPRLTGTQSLDIFIGGNLMLTSVDLSALKEAFEINIQANENLKKISLPSLTTTSDSFIVSGNPNVKKLCASKLESAAQVCIGNQIDQPDLDADLSELVTGSLFPDFFCYQDSNAPTVCGPSGDGGLFSSTSGGCPSNACL